MKFLNGIFKWIAMLTFSLSAGLLAIIFLSDNPQINPFLLRVLILLAVGLTSGFFMRVLYRKGYRILQVFFGLLASVLVILGIDYFYKPEYSLSFLREGFKFQIPTISDAAQMGLLLLISLPVILLFRKKRRPKSAEKPVSKPVRLSFSDRMKPIMYQVNPKNWNIRLPDLHKDTKPKNVSTSVKMTSPSVHISSTSSKKKSSNEPNKFVSKKSGTSSKIKLPGKKFHNKNNDVKLMGEEEHVCPYCLEEVVKNDTRGVAICPECHTWHHQDCWDITGGCGVAHRNQL